jgi:hypothetical protein
VVAGLLGSLERRQLRGLLGGAAGGLFRLDPCCLFGGLLCGGQLGGQLGLARGFVRSLLDGQFGLAMLGFVAFGLGLFGLVILSKVRLGLVYLLGLEAVLPELVLPDLRLPELVFLQLRRLGWFKDGRLLL